MKNQCIFKHVKQGNGSLIHDLIWCKVVVTYLIFKFADQQNIFGNYYNYQRIIPHPVYEVHLAKSDAV